MILISSKCIVKGCPKDSHRWESEGPSIRLTLREILAVQETLGMEPHEFNEALGTVGTGLTAAGARAWLMTLVLLHRRDGIPVAYEEVDADLGALELILDPIADGAEPEGKGEGTGTPTTPSPHLDDPQISASGPATGEESEPRSSTTPPNSGSSTD